MADRVQVPSAVGSEHRASAERRSRVRDYRQARVRSHISETVARFLIGYRQRHDLTQRQLGELLRMKESAISRLESGDHTPNAETLERIVNALQARFTFTIEEQSERERVPA